MLQSLLAEGRPLLADGASGANLFAMGLTSGDPGRRNGTGRKAGARPNVEAIVAALGPLVAPPATESGASQSRRRERT